MRYLQTDRETASTEFHELRALLLKRYTLAGIANIAQRSVQSVHQYALKPTSPGFRIPKPEVIERLREAAAALGDAA